MGLLRLSIKNYLLVDNLEVEFHPGFNVITGETGAGKSLIIGSLNIALGEKIDWDLMGEKEAEITAVFSLSEEEKEILRRNKIEVDEEIIVRRILNPTSKKSKIYINMSTVTLSFLKEITEHLIDLHGQHQHQSLLDPQRHIDYLDGFANILKEREKMKHLYDALLDARGRLDDLKKKQREAQEKEEFYRFKLDELEKANLKESEEEELEERLNILSNIEKLQSNVTASAFEIYESEESAYEKIFRAIRSLQEIVSIDAKLNEAINTLQEISDKLQDTWRLLMEYKNDLVLNPEELEEVRTRLTFLKNLKQKYRKSIEELIQEKEFLKSELSRIENYDKEIDALTKEIYNLEKQVREQAEILHEARVKSAPELERLIEEELKDLAMEKARFKVNISEGEINHLGKDTVEFYISTNPGEEPKPLSKIVSGGELSRIMLAIKRVLADLVNVPTMVFDEADTGIGGKVAEKVGRKMKEISQKRQVIVITHLPQIAAFGEKHFIVEKFVEGDKTRVKIRELSEQERVREIARMLSGEKITEESLNYAEKFLKSIRG
ncbi:MAG: DNA repair protein RecN [bacterium]|nr:DNA repair protein RecN [bacterium]